MKIRSGDTIVVTAGKDKGKTAKVVRVLLESSQVVAEGINLVKRHMKKQGSTPGQIVTFEKPINVSNVMFMDPKLGVPTRIGFKVVDGKKVRFAKKSGTTL